ncbi:MAG: ParB/RepB/Spo0J family partition protein [Vicinamibacterales bacterium]
MTEKRRALGKGLSALIPEAPEPASTPLEVDIDLLAPNKFQPRSAPDEAGLERLARSIRENGVIQPLLVRKTGDAYEIIAGERRWRAAQRAGLLRVPVVVRDVPPGAEEKLLEIALVENVQRENLNPVEEAQAYQRLSEQFHLKQEEIAAAVGKDRSSVANMLRLLRLPHEVQQMLAGGQLAMGHARAILALDEPARQRRMAALVVSKGLSVRQTEHLVKRMTDPAAAKPRQSRPKDVHTRAAEEQLRISLGTAVRIARGRKGGRIEIDFKNEDELQRLYERLTAR